ncbi:MAG: cytochrome c biogenesis protein CcdA [Clostridia bacterium]|nr:cytochrome c biogenesis protein CcdA [Clostridia bacterium]
MQYLITFLEGVISFISPCVLPMLPVYVSYFAGGANKKQKGISRALAFVLGFTVVFCLLGLFAGSLGALLTKYQIAVNIVCGSIVIVLGLSFLDILPLPFFKGMGTGQKVTGFFSAFLFGMIFSVSLTPCVGAFLGSALMLASSSGTAVKGVLLLFTYSLGMGIPFFLSAMLIEKLNTVFQAIKRHYKIINLVCGIFLMVVGLSMMTGMLQALLNLFS